MASTNKEQEKAFAALAAEVEPQVLPLCEWYQSNAEMTREQRKACLNHSVFVKILNFFRTYYDTSYDPVAFTETLIYCLKSYRVQGKTFLHLFTKIYFNKTYNQKAQERLMRVDAEAARPVVRAKLRELLAVHGMVGTEATERLHAAFDKNTILFPESRKRFLEKIHCTQEEIDEFEASVSSSGYVESLGESEMADATYHLEQWGVFADKAEALRSIAKTEKEQTYLRYFLTLMAMETQDEIHWELAPYIDEDYFSRHRGEKHGEAMDAIARHLGLSPRGWRNIVLQLKAKAEALRKSV